MEPTPRPEHLKVVKITECVPGHADQPDDGENIAIIRLSHCGKPDHPLLITMKDTKKLVVQLLRVLLCHGEEISDDIRETLYGETSGGKKCADRSRPSVKPSTPTNLPTTTITIQEAAKFSEQLGNARDDIDLLRCLGLSDAQIGRQRAKKYPRVKKRRK
jgi:hypothetical protein